MDERSAEQYEALAEFLHSIGWKSPNDAQWTRLRDAMPDIARLACPPSYAVVPVEPTEEMQGAGCTAHDQYGRDPKWQQDKHPMTAACYRAMIKVVVEESK